MFSLVLESLGKLHVSIICILLFSLSTCFTYLLPLVLFIESFYLIDENASRLIRSIDSKAEEPGRSVS